MYPTSLGGNKILNPCPICAVHALQGLEVEIDHRPLSPDAEQALIIEADDEEFEVENYYKVSMISALAPLWVILG